MSPWRRTMWFCGVRRTSCSTATSPGSVWPTSPSQSRLCLCNPVAPWRCSGGPCRMECVPACRAATWPWSCGCPTRPVRTRACMPVRWKTLRLKTEPACCSVFLSKVRKMYNSGSKCDSFLIVFSADTLFTHATPTLGWIYNKTIRKYEDILLCKC